MMLKNRKIFFILLVGIFIRVLLMPFFAHGDIIAVHRRVGKIVCQGDSLLNYSAPGAHLFEAVFAKLFTPFVSCHLLAGLQTNFYQPPFLNRMLFFFKLPYLLFELGFWWVVFEIFKNKNEKVKKRLAVFLAFNPVIIYSVYLFGRFETYQIFFSMVLIWTLNKLKQLSWKKGLTITGLMFLILTIRPSYIYIVPALILTLLPWKTKGIFWGLLPSGLFGILTFLPKFLSNSPIVDKQLEWLKTGTHPNYVFQAAVNIGQERKIFFFFLITGMIFLWWWERRSQFFKQNPAKTFSLLSSLIWLTFYGTSIFHPQYFSWFLPFFLVLLVDDQKDFLWQSFWLGVPFYFLTILAWGNYTTFGLLFPVSLAFRQIEPGWYLPLFPTIKWANIGRSIFSAFCFYWIYYLIRNFSSDGENR
ncbi:hypothetical protein J7J95_01810 [bacterium]|nr:hypothetical protein [bacterium]